MDCPEHERLEHLLMQTRAARKVSPEENMEQFQKQLIEESQAVENLKDHDAERGCQRI
jgi:hypothetical protein